MKTGKLIAGAVLAGGAFYALAKSGTLTDLGIPADAAGLDLFGAPVGPDRRTAAQRARDEALRATAPGNAPIVPSPGFFGSAAGVGAIDTAIVSAVGLLGAAGAFGGALATGAATLGIGFAVVFLSYEFLKQRASMHTNDVRDAWTQQFIALHEALMGPFTPVPGNGPGDLEMAEVIFYFDRDTSQRLWHAVQDTQDERQFRAAANAVDRFLTSRGVPVQEPS